MATRVGPTTFCMVPLNRPSPKTPGRRKHLRSICHTSRLIGDFVLSWGINRQQTIHGAYKKPYNHSVPISYVSQSASVIPANNDCSACASANRTDIDSMFNACSRMDALRQQRCNFRAYNIDICLLPSPGSTVLPPLRLSISLQLPLLVLACSPVQTAR